MKRLMRLTSPHMKGKNIEALQRALKKKGYLQGAVDGEFGPDTHRAVYKAKYWLGYAKPDHVAGDFLYGLLTGKRKPTPAMKTRIALRKRKLAKKSIGLKMLEESVKYLGVKEHPPGSNQVLFSRWYGIIGPWCAMVCTFCGVKVGSKAFKKGSRWAYVPFIVNDARAGRHNIAITYKPIDGDMVCFDWQMGGYYGIADHVGLWASEATLQRIAPEALRIAKANFGPLGQGEFWCVEGNTAVGNDSNGGEHMLRKRHKAQVQAYVHVGR